MHLSICWDREPWIQTQLLSHWDPFAHPSVYTQNLPEMHQRPLPCPTHQSLNWNENSVLSFLHSVFRVTLSQTSVLRTPQWLPKPLLANVKPTVSYTDVRRSPVPAPLPLWAAPPAPSSAHSALPARLLGASSALGAHPAQDSRSPGCWWKGLQEDANQGVHCLDSPRCPLKWTTSLTPINTQSALCVACSVSDTATMAGTAPRTQRGRRNAWGHHAKCGKSDGKTSAAWRLFHVEPKQASPRNWEQNGDHQEQSVGEVGRRWPKGRASSPKTTGCGDLTQCCDQRLKHTNCCNAVAIYQ